MNRVYIEADRKRMVGEIGGDRIYRKRVKGSKHLHRKTNAWGIDAELLKSLEEKCTEVRVLDEETNTVYSTTPQKIREEGIFLNFKPHGLQAFLPLIKWKTYDYVSK